MIKPARNHIPEAHHTSSALPSAETRARCSSVVRAFAHGAMGRRIDEALWLERSLMVRRVVGSM